MTAFAQRPPLLVAAVPSIGPLAKPWVRDVVLVVAASLVLAAVAQISFNVPFSADRTGKLVPITGQTFGVLLIGVTLGSRRSFAAVMAYLMWGWAGAPFYASGGSGFAALFTGTTSGYLWGFVVAAYVVGWLAERGFDRGPWLIAAMLIGNALIYVVGLPVLALWIHNAGLPLSVWDAGLWPFMPGDMAKLLAAATAVPTAWAAVDRFAPRRAKGVSAPARAASAGGDILPFPPPPNAPA